MKNLSVIALSIVVASAIAGTNNIAVTVNGTAVSGRPAMVVGSTILVPLRETAHALGATLSASNGLITLLLPSGSSLMMRNGRTTAELDGRAITLEMAPRVISGSTYVHANALADFVGGRANWNADLQTVSISSSMPTITASTVRNAGSTSTQMGGQPAAMKVPTVALIPWRFTDCTDGGAAEARRALEKNLIDRGLSILDESTIRQACQRVLGTLDPVRDALPSPKQMLEIGKLVNATYVVAGRVDWDTKTPFVFPRGLVTKAYTSCDAVIVDTANESVVLDARGVKTDSENKNDTATYASWLLAGLPNVFSGGPKDPTHRVAGAAVIGKTLSQWKTTSSISDN